MLLTFNVRHGRDLSIELKNARKVAEFALHPSFEEGEIDSMPTGMRARAALMPPGGSVVSDDDLRILRP